MTHDDEVRAEMREHIEALFRDFNGGEDKNPNGGRNTEMTGWGAMDFVNQAETELSSERRYVAPTDLVRPKGER